MSYTVKFVVIIGIVAVVSFFTASLVIPEKNAVAPSRKSAPRTMAPPAHRGGGDILVVVADGKPAEKPIAASESRPVPPDLNVLAPAGAPKAVARDTGAAAVAPAVAVSAGPKVPVADAKVPVVEAKAVDANPVMFSPNADTVIPVAAPFVGRAVPLPDARYVPPNTVVARLIAESDSAAKAASADVAAPPAVKTALAAAPPPVAAQMSVAAPPDTAKKKRPDPNAPLGYRLAAVAVCAAVENRAPKGVADKFAKESGAVYYFTHAVGAVDSAAVMHRWYREGKLIQTSILEIKSPNWRTHSKRNLATMDEPAGNWRVEVVDRRSGKVLESASFVVE
ncbi:MAG: DUF2914 domain-containing protein [Chitinispirillales bacterium]|nr:DUF2914 domain-containing protein [Chitinispirillales bacterium]